MPFARPTLNELIDRVTTDISGRVTGVESAVLRRSLLGILARSEAGAVHMLYGFLEWAARQAIIDTAEKEYLERWAAIWKIFRKPADYAEGIESADVVFAQRSSNKTTRSRWDVGGLNAHRAIRPCPAHPGKSVIKALATGAGI